LWFDGFGKLAGFVISEEGASDFAIITTEGYRFLFEEMLNWAMENFGGRGPALSIEITALQTMEAAILERYQFTKDASFYRSHFDLTSELGKVSLLADGFRIVDMKNHPDIRAKCILRRNAFGGKSDMNEEEIARESKIHEFGHQSPIYHPETDLYVVSPEGIFVSGCEALIDIQNLEADIERVCTHSNYRRRGFARVVIWECLARLQAMGIKKAHITGYSQAAVALYGSLSEGNQSEYLVYKG
jgi:ribosomal protein S18 acetylase RimI-like enzyme